MARKKILVIDAHPDKAPAHFVHALATQYAAAANAAGHLVQVVRVSELKFPWLCNADEFAAQPPGVIASQQQHFRWADHVVILYPLWLGSMPALLKAYLEQVLRPGFAFEANKRGWSPKLRGKTARVVVTMGMPAAVYRWFFGAHGLKSLRRNILSFVGIRPVRATLLGSVENVGPKRRARWLANLEKLGLGAQ